MKDTVAQAVQAATSAVTSNGSNMNATNGSRYHDRPAANIAWIQEADVVLAEMEQVPTSSSTPTLDELVPGTVFPASQSRSRSAHHRRSSPLTMHNSPHPALGDACSRMHMHRPVLHRSPPQ
jgi:hypothetical protein